MNPQNFMIAGELLFKAVNYLTLLHKHNYPKNFHDGLSSLINEIKTTVKELPVPEETKKDEDS